MSDQEQINAMMGTRGSPPPQDPQLQAMLEANLKPDESATALGHSTNFLTKMSNTIAPFAQGVAKGELSTLKGMGTLGEKALEGVGFTPGAKIYQPGNPEEQKAQLAVTPQGAGEQAGFGAEKVGEFFTPMGAEKGLMEKGASYIEKLPELMGIAGTKAKALAGTLKTALQGAIGATSIGGVTAAQTGGDLGQIKTGAELGATGGTLSALKYSKGLLPDLLSFTSGVPKGAVAKAMESPESLKVGINSSMQEIRSKAETAIGAIDKDMKNKFSEGLLSLQKKYPSRLGAFNNAKGFFKTALQDAKAGIPSIFRDYGVSVKEGGKTLDFEKLNSPIVKGSEQTNLQEAINTINRQTDFSPKSVQRVAARLEALTKYGENNESSAIITRVKNAYASAIEKSYPELGQLRKQYGETAGKISDIKNIIGKASDNPKQIQASVNRLTQIFNDDKETYLNTIKTLSDMTGVDFEGLVASDKFKQILPSYIRGLGGGGAVSLGGAAVAHFLNPFYLLALPLFSPAAIGKGIQVGEKLPSVGSTATRGVISATQSSNEAQATSSQ